MATVRLGEALTKRIDDLREDVPRERFVRRVLEEALDGRAVARPVEQVEASRVVGPEKAPRSPVVVPASPRAHAPAFDARAAALERQQRLNQGKYRG